MKSLHVLTLLALTVACLACGRNVDTATDAATGDDSATTWPAPSATLSPQQRRVIDEVVKLPSLDHHLRVYGLPEALTPGAQVFSADAESGAAALPLTEPSWFFYIDDAPRALFGHGVRYVLLGAQTGSLTVLPAQAWPERGGVALFGASENGQPSPNLVYATDAGTAGQRKGSLTAPLADAIAGPPLCPDGKPGKRYALLIRGAGENQHVMENSLNMVKAALLVAGAGDFAISEAKAGKYNSLADDIDAAVKAISGKVRCCDEVLVYIIGHGHRLVRPMADNGKGQSADWLRVDETGTVLSAGGGKYGSPYTGKVAPNAPSRWQFFVKAGVTIDADKLFAMLGKLVSCHTTLVVESCFSGALIDEMAGQKGVAAALTSQARTTPSPTDDDASAVGPATEALLAGLKVAAGSDLAGQLGAKWAADKSKNKFTTAAEDPRGGKDAGQYPTASTDASGKKIFSAWPQQYKRDDSATPCPCCGNGIKEAGEGCDPGGTTPVLCPAEQICLPWCECAVCTKSTTTTVPTESEPGKTCGTGTPVKVSYTVAPASGGYKLQATLSATFATPAQSGMFVRLVRQDGAKLYMGAIGTQYSAFVLDSKGKKTAAFPCTGTQLTGADGPGWSVVAEPVLATAFSGVTAAQVDLTDGNCAGDIDIGLPPSPGACPW